MFTDQRYERGYERGTDQHALTPQQPRRHWRLLLLLPEV